jgi:hypothetical protein
MEKTTTKYFCLVKVCFANIEKKTILINDFIVRVSSGYAGKAFNSNETFLSKKKFKLLFLTSDTIAF